MTPTELLKEDSIVTDHASFILNYLANYFWIALGAVVGASARYFLNTLIARNFSSAFPYGTLLINITGSLVLGFFLVFSIERSLLDPRCCLLLAIGFCGSYTPFSSSPLPSFPLLDHWHTLPLRTHTPAIN